jgi:hypothetical protein
MVEALGGTAHEIVDMDEMEALAHDFYHSRSEGGEGHLEVAKNIYYSHKSYAHMVLSLKPFGCMPSTQSDGAQSAVVNRYKDMIFLPIETSGEGEINAHSRVQMALGEAKAKAKREFAEVLESLPYSLEQLRGLRRAEPRAQAPDVQVPAQDPQGRRHRRALRDPPDRAHAGRGHPPRARRRRRAVRGPRRARGPAASSQRPCLR